VHRVDHLLVETQIRTITQHGWATAAERAEQVTGFPLKFGDAPVELLDYFRVASTIHALEEHRNRAEDELLDELAELRERIRKYYRSNR
jgi:ppGpp synthetase/RelA/SpoT-type nucleotidyltranferase